MSRTRKLPLEGIRRTITFRPDLDEKLAVMAAQQRLPISTIVERLLDLNLRSLPTPEELAVEFPPGWDGFDLRRRLYYLRMRQTDLAKALGIPNSTVNSWLCRGNPLDQDYLPEIMKVLGSHIPIPIDSFRAGSKSPGF